MELTNSPESNKPMALIDMEYFLHTINIGAHAILLLGVIGGQILWLKRLIQSPELMMDTVFSEDSSLAIGHLYYQYTENDDSMFSLRFKKALHKKDPQHPVPCRTVKQPIFLKEQTDQGCPTARFGWSSLQTHFPNIYIYELTINNETKSMNRTLRLSLWRAKSTWT